MFPLPGASTTRRSSSSRLRVRAMTPGLAAPGLAPGPRARWRTARPATRAAGPGRPRGAAGPSRSPRRAAPGARSGRRLGDGVVVTVVGAEEAGRAGRRGRALAEGRPGRLADRRRGVPRRRRPALTGRRARSGRRRVDPAVAPTRAPSCSSRQGRSGPSGGPLRHRAARRRRGGGGWRPSPARHPTGPPGHVGMNADVTERREQAAALGPPRPGSGRWPRPSPTSCSRRRAAFATDGRFEAFSGATLR